MTILSNRTAFKPFEYDWAFELYKKQSQEMIWTPDEIDFSQDVRDYNHNLDIPTKEFVRKILLFFTQSDSDIANSYVANYLLNFPKPELRMMLLAFANMESNHANAYAKLVDTLGFSDYAEFLRYPEMKEKHDYHTDHDLYLDSGDSADIAMSIVITSVMGEGLQLFGSFIMLLSLVERGFLPGMGRVVQWSLRDETVHVKGMTNIYKQMCVDFPYTLGTDKFKRAVYATVREMVELEDRFISLVYTDDLDLPNLSKPVLHQYIRFIADMRLSQIGLKPVYYVDDCPIPWLTKFEGVIHEDLFSGAGTEYTRTTFAVEDMY